MNLKGCSVNDYFCKQNMSCYTYKGNKADLTDSFSIPAGVTSIGTIAFYECEALTNVIIPDSVTSIGIRAFCGCTSLASIAIPDSVRSIGGYAFACCTSLTSITIPDSVKSIGEYAFAYCTSLTSITIPDSVTSISLNVFRNCNVNLLVCPKWSKSYCKHKEWKEYKSKLQIQIDDIRKINIQLLEELKSKDATIDEILNQLYESTYYISYQNTNSIFHKI